VEVAEELVGEACCFAIWLAGCMLVGGVLELVDERAEEGEELLAGVASVVGIFNIHWNGGRGLEWALWVREGLVYVREKVGVGWSVWGGSAAPGYAADD
jgi:hypothetical protein